MVSHRLERCINKELTVSQQQPYIVACAILHACIVLTLSAKTSEVELYVFGGVLHHREARVRRYGIMQLNAGRDVRSTASVSKAQGLMEL